MANGSSFFTNETYARGDQAYVAAVEAAQAAADAATQAAEALSAAGGAEDGLITTWFQDDAPTGQANGDLWFDTNDNNKLYRWKGDYGNVARTNACPNPSAAYNSTGWSAVAGTLSTDSTVLIGDRASWKVLITDLSTVGDLSQRLQWTAQTVGVTAGDTWAMSGYVRSSTLSAITKYKARIVWYNASGVEVGRTEGPVVTALAADQWAKVEVSGAAPTGATKFDFHIGPFDGAELNVSDAFWVGDIVFEKASTTGVFFSGSMPNATWISVVGNSGSMFAPAWQLAADQRVAQAITDAAGAQATADGKIRTFYNDNPPAMTTGENIGDLWTDTNDNNKMYRWDGSTWVAISDLRVDTSIKTVTTEYAVNSSETVAPTTGWSTATPTRTPGTFVWYRVTTTRTDNSTSTSNAALLTGNTGATGAAGTPASLISVTASTQVLSTPAGGGATTPATSTVTGVASNTTIANWTYSVDGAAFSGTVPAGVSRSTNTVTITGSTMTAKTIAIKADNGGTISDTITVAKVSDGATGATGGTGPTGSAGADAYTVLLSNEAQVFAGSVNAALAGTATSTVIAYKGTTQQSATIGTITGQVTGLTTAITNNGTTAPVVTVTVTTALTQQSGTLTIPITVNGVSFTKLFGWSVSYTGATGATGPTGPAGATGPTGPQGVGVSSVTPYWQTVTSGAAAPALPTLNPPGGTWTSAEPNYTVNTDLYQTVRIVYSDSTFAYTPVSKSSSYSAANSKTKTFNNATTSIPTSLTAGDIWIPSDQPNLIYLAYAAGVNAISSTGWMLVSQSTPRIVTVGTTSKIFYNPVTYSSQTATITDNIVIETPITFTNVMFKAKIVGYNYSGANNDIELSVGGYAYATGPAMVNARANVLGNVPITVRMARNATTNNVAIILSGVTFSYPRLYVEQAQIGYSALPPDTWLQGWSVSVVTEANLATNYNLTVAAPADNALTTANSALTTANGKNKVYYNTTLPGTTTNMPGDIWYQYTTTGQPIGMWIGTGNGSGGSGTGWQSQLLQDSVLGTLNAAKITTGTLGVGVTMSAGDPTQSHAEVTGTGFYAYSYDPDQGAPALAVRMGTSQNDLFAITDSTGQSVAAISDTGFVTAAGVSSNNDINIRGSNLYGVAGDMKDDITDYVAGTGRSFETDPMGTLEALPQGCVARAFWTQSTFSTTTVASGGIFHLFNIGTDTLAGRSYVLEVAPVWINVANVTATNNYCAMVIRRTLDGTDPTSTSPQVGTLLIHPKDGGWISVPGFRFRHDETIGRDVRFGVWITTQGCDYTMVNTTANIVAGYIMDEGPMTVITGTQVNSITQSGGTPPAPPPTVKSYTKTYASNGWATYRSINAPLRGSSASVGDTGSHIYQGYSSAGSYNGDQRGLWTFPSITTDVGSGTITKIEAYIYFSHWFNSAGGTAGIHAHGYAANGWPTSSLPTLSTGTGLTSTVSGWPNPGGKWITLPSGMYAGFKSGTYKGFAIGPAGSTSTTFYGYADPGAQLRVSYTK